MRATRWSCCVLLLFLWAPTLIAGESLSKCLLVEQGAFTQYSTQTIAIPIGQSRVTLQCEIDQQSVMSFRPVGFSSIVVSTPDIPSLKRLSSNDYSYLLPSGNTNITLDFSSDVPRQLTLRLDSVSRFQAKSNQHAAVMMAFVGFCFGLAIYVFLLGRGIQGSGYYAYSAYLLSAATFFSFQEGLLNYLLPSIQWHNHVRFQSLFAGLVVFFAYQFLSRLLELKLILPNWLNRTMNTFSSAIFISAILLFVAPALHDYGLSALMGWSVLLLICTLFILSAYASLQRVHMAGLIFWALGVVFFAMIFRIWLVDASPFMHRYALIISTAVESLLFAIAASEKVKFLEYEKKQVYKSAVTDKLCNILNLQGWTLAAKRKIEQYRIRDGYFALVYFEISNFKAIKEQFGLAISDSTLATIAKIIRHQTREDDIVGRIGSDEFAVLSLATDSVQAERIQRRYVSKLRTKSIWLDGQQIHIKVNVGHAIMASNAADLTHMLEDAEQTSAQPPTVQASILS